MRERIKDVSPMKSPGPQAYTLPSKIVETAGKTMSKKYPLIKDTNTPGVGTYNPMKAPRSSLKYS